MWLFLGSECLLFGGLISTYMLYRGRTQDGPKPGPGLRHPVHVDQLVHPADELADDGAGGVGGQARRHPPHPAVAVLATAALGSLFVGGQVYEFTAFYREGLGFTTSLFGSSFYTLTGFHGVHVSVGIIMLISLVVITLRGRIDGDRSEVIDIVGLYWHFVDIVWIVIFTLVYLIPA